MYINNQVKIWFSTVLAIALVLLIFYLIWLVIVLYFKYVEIDKIYEEWYKKRLKIEENINEIKRIQKNNELEKWG